MTDPVETPAAPTRADRLKEIGLAARDGKPLPPTESARSARLKEIGKAAQGTL